MFHQIKELSFRLNLNGQEFRGVDKSFQLSIYIWCTDFFIYVHEVLYLLLANFSGFIVFSKDLEGLSSFQVN